MSIESATTSSQSQQEVPTDTGVAETTQTSITTTTTTTTEKVAEGKCGVNLCWPRKSWGMILLMVFNLLMIVVVVILLFVVDLSTNQIADTAILALVFIFTAIYWYMSCDCGAAIQADGNCAQAAGCGLF
jgi:hypothetical protein